MRRFKIRKIYTYSAFKDIQKIQKKVWHHGNIDITPLHHLNISSRTGAILLGAFLDEKMVGFVYSFPAVFNQKLAQHSHQLAVLPQYRGLDIGKKLKWAQKKEALRKGYDLITWTADPLIAKNANLNLHTLRVEINTYIHKFYQETRTLSVIPGMPIDRLLIMWPIRNISYRRKKQELYSMPDNWPKALYGKQRDKILWPSSIELNLNDRYILVELIQNVFDFVSKPEVVLKWQIYIRKTLKHYFSRGYTAVDFLYGDRCYYILEKR